MMDQYINGLLRPEVRSHLQYRHPTSIHTAIALASEFEAFEGSHGILKKPYFENEDAQLNVVKYDSQDTHSAQNKYDGSHVSRSQNKVDLAKLITEGFSNLTEALKASRSRSRTRSNDRNFKCYECNEPGHIASHCPHRNQKKNTNIQ